MTLVALAGDASASVALTNQVVEPAGANKGRAGASGWRAAKEDMVENTKWARPRLRPLERKVNVDRKSVV